MLEQSLKNTLTYQNLQMVSTQLAQHHTGENTFLLTLDTFTVVVLLLELQLSVMRQLQLTP